MATANKFQDYIGYPFAGLVDHDTDQFELAFTNNSNIPSVSADAVLADIVQITYTGFPARTVTTTSSGESGGTYTLVLTDKVLTMTATTNAFQHVVLFNQTAASDPLIMFWSYTSEITLTTDETFTVNFAATTMSIT